MPHTGKYTKKETSILKNAEAKPGTKKAHMAIALAKTRKKSKVMGTSDGYMITK